MISSHSQKVTFSRASGEPLPDGAEYRFTRDGTTPNDTSELYVEPFVVDRSTNIKAVILGGDKEDSDVSSFPIVIRVATPVITPASGSFSDPTIITITCATPNAEIRFTLDGPLPDESSTLYTGPFLVDQSRTIQARAFLAPKDPSLNASANIVIVSTSAVYFGYSPLRILNEAQIKALSNAPEASNIVTKSDIFGTYRIGAGATESDYFVWWVPDTFSHPRATDGFNIPASGVFGNIPMAEVSQGYTEGPVNGYYHLNVTVDGVPGRLYASFNQLGNSETPAFKDVLIQ